MNAFIHCTSGIKDHVSNPVVVTKKRKLTRRVGFFNLRTSETRFSENGNYRKPGSLAIKLSFRNLEYKGSHQ